MTNQLSPIQIAQIQIDAERMERLKIASSLRMMAMNGKAQGLSSGVADIIEQLASSIERGDLSR